MVSVSELCLAVKRGELENVRLFLSQGASVNESDENGDSVLHWAVFCGHSQVVDELMSLGAD